MSENKLTPREQEYFDCEVPLLSGGKATGRIIMGVFTSFAQAIIAPSSSYGKADRKIMRTIREIRYTKYKRAVIRKYSHTPEKGDEKLLKKLNKKPFILESETFDPDEFTKKIYEDYMKLHENSEE